MPVSLAAHRPPRHVRWWRALKAALGGSREPPYVAALDAMEAFHARTDNAIAPVLAAMDETQLVDFFGDFDADLPIELPELDPA